MDRNIFMFTLCMLCFVLNFMQELKKLGNSTKETCRFNPFSRLCQRQPVRVPVLIEKVLNTLLQQEPPLSWYSRSQSKG